MSLIEPTPQPEPATAGLASDETGVGSVFVSNYPPYSAWSEGAVAALERTLEHPAAGPAEPYGIYLHIPFCRKRCKFCYFKVYTDKNAAEIGRYVDAVAAEAELLAERPALAGRRPGFVYFGGGTPSYVSVKHLRSLVERLRAALPWADGLEEFTFECEPGTLSRTRVAAIRDAGVTRLSLGVESFDDEILRDNGRAHLSAEVYEVMPWIRDAGFASLNIDLIAGMVGETWQSWRASVERTIELQPESVTVYQMELPYNAVYSARVLAGEMQRPLADWSAKRDWHGWAFERLAEAGYEVSSAYTMVRRGSGARFVYRDALWQGSDLLGLGVSSFGHLGGTHYQNHSGWAPYLEAVEAGRLPLSRAFETTPRDRLIRELILQLKRGRVEDAYFRDKFGVEIGAEFAAPLERLAAAGMLRRRAGGDELTRDGLLRVDFLLPRFYDDRHRGARYT